jgi:hypothetical protein
VIDDSLSNSYYRLNKVKGETVDELKPVVYYISISKKDKKKRAKLADLCLS